MTNATVFLAVAGAGKTYSIAQGIDPSKRNLILSYTHENILNLSTEITKKWGAIPEKTRIMTFDYFLISAFARPFLRRIQAEIFGKTPEEITRIDLFPLPSVNPNDGKTFILNSPKYFCHYFSGNKGNYALRLDSCADLPLMDKTFKDGKTLFQTAMDRLNQFFDCYYIDEFQDYRKSRFDLMVKIMQSVPQGFMYGDYFQHSVMGTNNSGKPFLKNTTYISFKKDLSKLGFKVDETTLSKTRRCSGQVCAFIQSNLKINILPDLSLGRVGNVYDCFQKNALASAIKNKKIQVLSLKPEYEIGSMSFGVSKGDTFENTVVVLPETCISINSQGNKTINPYLEGIPRNKVYVALSRATGDVYLTDFETAKSILG
jgi:hypothetical protein